MFPVSSFFCMVFFLPFITEHPRRASSRPLRLLRMLARGEHRSRLTGAWHREASGASACDEGRRCATCRGRTRYSRRACRRPPFHRDPSPSIAAVCRSWLRLLPFLVLHHVFRPGPAWDDQVGGGFDFAELRFVARLHPPRWNLELIDPRGAAIHEHRATEQL